MLGLSIASLDAEDLGVSDHQCIRFFTCFHTVPNFQLPVRHSHSINTSTASNFSDTNSSIFGIRKSRANTQPWLNSDTRALRQLCQKAEHKKEKTQASGLANLASCQRVKYFGAIIFRNSHSPKGLFHTINSVLNSVAATCPVPTTAICEDFLKGFYLKNASHSIQYFNTLLRSLSAFLNDFQSVSLSQTYDTISHTKSTTCSLDVVPTHILKEALDTIGPTIFLIFNRSLANGTILFHTYNCPTSY
ncbi:hypothetical protein N1851_033786 [Merluccius polli]|uniref:Uncharacterized protein n=1 Tax=Merluccius polli TaxID=89951 RepID=A0AA47M0U4_MERPO|nr:hypothetical protein N1851_033786 [Merluccius polli]